MSITVAITNNAPSKYRGYLSSCFLEILPTVYVSSKISKRTRIKIQETLKEWYTADGINQFDICLIWSDAKETGGIGVFNLGYPKSEIIEFYGIYLSKDPIPKSNVNPNH
jgi:CRISPR-associated protein Cas2